MVCNGRLSFCMIRVDLPVMSSCELLVANCVVDFAPTFWIGSSLELYNRRRVHIVRSRD